MPYPTEALIKHTAKNLAGLGKTSEVATFANQNSELVENLIQEFDEAVESLNAWLFDGYHRLLWAPKAKELHPHLGSPPRRLATIDQICWNPNWRRWIISGLREERKLLAAGEADME